MADESVPKTQKKRGRRVPILPESEKKRRKKAYNQNLAKSRIYIGATLDRWNALKEQINVEKDDEMASFLIERYERSAATLFKEPQSALRTQGSPITGSRSPRASTSRASSTPGPAFTVSAPTETERTPSVSEISAESEIEPMSGVEELQGSSQEDTCTERKGDKQVTKRSRKPVQLSESMCDPFNLSIDITQEFEVDADKEDDDPDYQQSFDITAILSDDVNEMAEDVPFEEMEYGFEVPGNDGFLEGPDVEKEIQPGVQKVLEDGACHELTTTTKCIAFVKQIKELTKISVPQCKEMSCKKPTNIVESFVGSAMYLKWVCEENHVSHQWCSQPQLNRRLHSGDFLVCGSILSSGNNYGKMALWAQMLSLKFPSADQFHKICSTYIIPSIENHWNDHKRDLLQDFKDKDVVVLGDGRNDSPGHCAQYCSYTLMDNDSKKIMTIHTLDKRMTDRKSTNMEKAGFEAAMNELLEKDIKVKEVVTDAHLGIGSIMKKQYSEIHHSHDIWHAAKNLGKKVLKVAQKKGNSILLEWCKDIVNHFWFSCREADTYEEFVGIWRSVLHHITNTHEWILSHGGVNHCLHGELTEEERTKSWLSPTKHAHVLKDLASVVLDKRLLNNVGYFLKFRSTAELEGFHQHLLMYCSKRFAYSPPVYRARNLLAALDHNMNVDRPVQKNKNGEIRYHRVFNKKSGRWTVHAVKTRKDYSYVHSLLASALIMRLNDPVGMKQTTLAPDDPRNISKHLAAQAPPPTEEIVEQQKSRFNE